MPLLRARLYIKNPFARQFVISWISVLHAVPDINMVIFLPDLLDGLLNILEDQTMEIKKMYVCSISNSNQSSYINMHICIHLLLN